MSLPITEILFKSICYMFSIVAGDLLHQCTFQLYREYTNITLRSTRMFGTIWSMLRQKFSCNLQVIFIGWTLVAIITSTKFRGFVNHSDFWTVLFTTILLKELRSICHSEDTYANFIRNSGLDCGSFMAYSFFRGYIEIVVPSTSDPNSKDLKERMEDYEATQDVTFPIKKLLILQPKSMYIPNKLNSEWLEDVKSLEEIKINRGGVLDRSYQLSVYKIKDCNWYVNVQGASPLLTYADECKYSKMLEKYKNEVGISFRDHLKKLIWDNLSCRELVEVIYYDDLNEHGKRVDVGLVLKKFIEESLSRSI